MSELEQIIENTVASQAHIVCDECGFNIKTGQPGPIPEEKTGVMCVSCEVKAWRAEEHANDN